MIYNQKEIGNRVRLLRLQSNLSQRELAKKLGSSKSVISRFERGVYKSLNTQVLDKYCAYFKLNYKSFIYASNAVNNKTFCKKIKAFFSKIKRWF